MSPKDLNALFNTHDLPGETFRRVSNDLAYLKLTVKLEQAAKHVESAAGTKGLIVDIRKSCVLFQPGGIEVLLIGDLRC